MNRHELISLSDVTKVTISPIHTLDWGMVQGFCILLTIETKECKIEIILEAEAKENLVIVEEY